MSRPAVQRGFVAGRRRAAVAGERAFDRFFAVARLRVFRVEPARVFFFAAAFRRGAGAIVPAVPAAPVDTRVECFGR